MRLPGSIKRFHNSMKMRNERSSIIFLMSLLLQFAVKNVSGKSLAFNTEFASTIEGLRHDIRKVLHFIESFNENVEIPKSDKKGSKSRSVIAYDQQALNNLLADESVMKATAKTAANAVEESQKATRKTQKGVKQIAKGLKKLKKCLRSFENVVKI